MLLWQSFGAMTLCKVLDHRVALIVLAFLMPVVPVASIADAQKVQDAAEVVASFQTKLISVMKRAKELGYQGRYDTLAPLVESTHDLSAIARIVLGRYWGRLNADQKLAWTETFAQLSIATYAHKFDGFAGEWFEFVSAEDTSRDDKFIRTRLRKAGDQEIRFDYLLRQNDQRWLIINIIADGVSDLALKRSEYSAVIRRDGFDALIKDLANKIETYSHSQ
jgi:phospholipid transport system substrate-binding protein